MATRKVAARLVRRGEGDEEFDRQFWADLGHEARFAAAWEMVAEADLFRGNDVRQPRLQRSVQRIQRREG